MNVATISGTLGRDAEHKEYSGKHLVQLSVAIERFIKGEKVTQWARVAWWFQQAPSPAMLALYVKGAKVVVSGEASASAYLKNGEAQAVFEIAANRVEFVAGPREQQQPATSQPQAQYVAKNDELPF